MSENIYETPSSNVETASGSPVSLSTKEILLSFKGRIPRKTYWLYSLALFVVVFVLIFAVALVLPENLITTVTLILYVPLVWISLAIQVKRWHDRDKAGWWVLISFVPIIGPIWALIENGFLPGTEGDNRFGSPSA